MIAGGLQEATRACNEPVAAKVLNSLRSICERIEALDARVSDKLSPIMMPTPQNPETDKEQASLRPTYPPLFDDMRSCVVKIERHMNSIHTSLDLAEL